MTDPARNPHIGSSLDDFLGEQGILEECEYRALKEMLADQVRQAMKDNHITKTAMAERMQTSRRQLDRLLDSRVANVTLATLSRASRWYSSGTDRPETRAIWAARTTPPA